MATTALKTPARNDTATATAGTMPAIFHSSFEEPGAERRYGGTPTDAEEGPLGFMPDEVTRDCSQRMHYAAWRTAHAKSNREAARWRRRYLDYRDRIILGNRKLAFRAVQKWGAAPQLADDLGSECQVVLIKAVAAYNPWMGIRFSTYAFTCLMRALSRLSQRQAADRLARALPLEALALGEPAHEERDDTLDPRISRLDSYFRDENELLTPREKSVLRRRYHLSDDGATKSETLEQVGRDLGLSKERVRQVQLSALGKLREALLGTPPGAC